ncbi:hypothetical protein E2C01_020367 [Portunus trituberculatus]|uniref:Uncharacterized protein n=1 Tax=Portunus trituberculatus TaxID=210409 RepID=A0A5B7DZX2_PORTR|nr:hypothetical protein [Portunus trituberculatus]
MSGGRVGGRRRVGAPKDVPAASANGVPSPRQYSLHDFDIVKTIGEYYLALHVLVSRWVCMLVCILFTKKGIRNNSCPGKGIMA